MPRISKKKTTRRKVPSKKPKKVRLVNHRSSAKKNETRLGGDRPLLSNMYDVTVPGKRIVPKLRKAWMKGLPKSFETYFDKLTVSVRKDLQHEGISLFIVPVPQGNNEKWWTDYPWYVVFNYLKDRMENISKESFIIVPVYIADGKVAHRKFNLLHQNVVQEKESVKNIFEKAFRKRFAWSGRQQDSIVLSL